MAEHIYTIPLNDYFSKDDCTCAFCGIRNMLENNEICLLYTSRCV